MKVGDLVGKTIYPGDRKMGIVLEVNELREYDRKALESNEYIKVCWFNYGTFWTYDDKVELLNGV